MQCKGERNFLALEKDCDNCKEKFLCETKGVRAFKVSKESFVFAETEEQARLIAKRDRAFATDMIVTEVDVKKVGNTFIIK
jgi:hypothetical protein